MDKVNRMLMLFHSLIQGGKINKVDFAKSNNISERSVDRDIEDIRNYLAEIHAGSEVIFNKAENIYYLTNWNNYKFSSVEAITIFKILLGSKGLRKPQEKVNHYKTKQRDVDKIVRGEITVREHLERWYGQEYEYAESEVRYNKFNGRFYIYGRMRKIGAPERKKTRNEHEVCAEKRRDRTG